MKTLIYSGIIIISLLFSFCTKVKKADIPVNFPEISLDTNTIFLENSNTTIKIDSVTGNDLVYELFSDSLYIIVAFREQPTHDFIYLINDSREKYGYSISVYDSQSLFYKYNKTNSSINIPAKLYVEIDGNNIKGTIPGITCSHAFYNGNTYSHSIDKSFSLSFSTTIK